MEVTANAIQTVGQNQNVLFTETAVCGNRCIRHREGSGLIMLMGNTNQCKARYRVFFSGNIAIPVGGTVDEISLALSMDGEPVQSSRMRVTPAAVNNYFNVSSELYLDVPKGCCVQVAVENVSTQPILVQNANMIATREA